MSKQFTVKYLDKVKPCNGYAESSQVCADLVKRGIYPQIVIQYVDDDFLSRYEPGIDDGWDEKRIDIISQNGNEGLHYE